MPTSGRPAIIVSNKAGELATLVRLHERAHHMVYRYLEMNGLTRKALTSAQHEFIADYITSEIAGATSILSRRAKAVLADHMSAQTLKLATGKEQRTAARIGQRIVELLDRKGLSYFDYR